MLCMNGLCEEVFFKKPLDFCIGEGVQAIVSQVERLSH